MIFDSLFYSMRNANSQKYVIGSSPEAFLFLTEKRVEKVLKMKLFFLSWEGENEMQTRSSYQFVSFGALTLFLRPANLYFSHICKHKRSFHPLAAMRCERDIQNIKVALSIQIFSGFSWKMPLYVQRRKRGGEGAWLYIHFWGWQFYLHTLNWANNPRSEKIDIRSAIEELALG